jgi:hypothetical protein
MLCITCDYALSASGMSRCPEYGRAFSPDDSTSFETRRRSTQAIVGIAFTLGLGALAAAVLRWSWDWPYGDSHHAAFGSIFCAGAALVVAAAVLAARTRSWLGRIPLLCVGTLCICAALFLASDKYYRVWQSSPDPPREAFADTGPLGALLFGWLPALLLVSTVFAFALLAFFWGRRRMQRSTSRTATSSASRLTRGQAGR